MCAILGYYCFGTKRPDKERIAAMWIAAESRGTDACGFAYKKGSDIIVHKKPIKSSLFVKNEKSWAKLKEMPDNMILHTRHATQGHKANPMNNHPLQEKDNPYVVVHNGVIQNEHDFDVKIEQVDSLAIIRSLKENEGDIEATFSSLTGTFAVAALSKDDDFLRMFRHSNPTDVLLDINDDILYFASLSHYIKDAFKGVDEVNKWGLTFTKDRFRTITFGYDEGLIFDRSGLQEVIKCKYVYRTASKEADWSKYNSQYYDKKSSTYKSNYEIYEDLEGGGFRVDHDYYNDEGDFLYHQEPGKEKVYTKPPPTYTPKMLPLPKDIDNIHSQKVNIAFSEEEKTELNKEIKDELDFANSKLLYSPYKAKVCTDCDFIFKYLKSEGEHACPHCGVVNPIIKET